MLRRSWDIVVNTSIKRPGIVPLGSFASSIADRLWGNDLWLTWMNPAGAPLAGASGGVLGLEEPELEEQEVGEFEAAVTSHLQQIGYLRTLPATAADTGPAVLSPDDSIDTSVRDIRPPLDDEGVSRLVQILGIPRSNVENLVDKVDQKWGR